MHRRIRLGLSRSFQILSVFRNLTTFENVRVAVQAQSPQQNSLWRDAYRMADVNDRTWSLLAAVGLEDRAVEPCANLSHGEQRLLEIAIALATDAKLLLLDEPLAGLAEAEREVVGALIRQLAATHAVLLIEHDIDRVLALSDRITVLHQGRVIADGKPAEVASNQDVITAYMGTARAGGPQPTVRAAAPRAATTKPLLALEQVRAGYAGSLVLTDLDLVVHEGEAVALLGRNGVGKTTMLRAITGTVQKSAGRIMMDGADITHARPYEINRRGISIVPEGRRLFPNLTVMENLQIATRAGGASYDEIFGLFPKLRMLQRARAESLSGGERQMLAIARALVVPSRLILLDEPFEGLAPGDRAGGDGRAGAPARSRRDDHCRASRRDGAADCRSRLCAGQRPGRVRGQCESAGGGCRTAVAVARARATGTDGGGLAPLLEQLQCVEQRLDHTPGERDVDESPGESEMQRRR